MEAVAGAQGWEESGGEGIWSPGPTLLGHGGLADPSSKGHSPCLELSLLPPFLVLEKLFPLGLKLVIASCCY